MIQGHERLYSKTNSFYSQPFWGDMVAIAGAGPKPIPHKQLNVQNLSDAIRFCLTPEASAAAGELAAKMKTENGVATAAKSFHANLPLEILQCDILPDEPASWEFKRGKKHLKLSKKAAGILVDRLKISQKNMSLLVCSINPDYLSFWLTRRSLQARVENIHH